MFLDATHAFTLDCRFFVGFKIWMLCDKCGTAAMTFGLFPFYLANVKLQCILLLCAMPVHVLACFTVHKPDNIVGNLPCFYYGFCYFAAVIVLEAHLSELYKIRRYTTILNHRLEIKLYSCSVEVTLKPSVIVSLLT
jgi:hypothetical protein